MKIFDFSCLWANFRLFSKHCLLTMETEFQTVTKFLFRILPLLKLYLTLFPNMALCKPINLANLFVSEVAFVKVTDDFGTRDIFHFYLLSLMWLFQDLPLLCRDKKEFLPKIADILSQLLQTEDINEVVVVQNSLMTLFRRDAKGSSA